MIKKNEELNQIIFEQRARLESMLDHGTAGKGTSENIRSVYQTSETLEESGESGREIMKATDVTMKKKKVCNVETQCNIQSEADPVETVEVGVKAETAEVGVNAVDVAKQTIDNCSQYDLLDENQKKTLIDNSSQCNDIIDDESSKP